jgi:putative sterol carrier protein
MSDPTAEQVMERMPASFLPEKAAGVDAVINYQLSGEGGGDWTMTIRGGTCQVARGLAAEAKLTISADASDYVQVALGKLDAMAAFGAGKIKIKGDLPLSLKLMGMFKR